MYVCERELVVMRFEKGYENISCLKNTPQYSGIQIFVILPSDSRCLTTKTLYLYFRISL